MFSYVSADDHIPADHPIRKLRVLVDTILKELGTLLASRYATGGRVSISPERLLWTSPLRLVYTLRSERLVMEQSNRNALLR